MRRLAIALVVCAAVFAKEPRSRGWLIEYLTQPVVETPRNSRYLRLIDRELDATYLGLDLNFLENGGGDRSRAQTNAIGALAFCYRTPGLKYYHDSRLLEKLRLAFLAVARHINAEGFFQWPGDTAYYYQAHEQGWRLEPVLAGYIWVGEKFPAADRELIEAALSRAAAWMFRNPLTQRNNRGAVWCAVLTMAGVYFENPKYLAQVELHADDVMNGVVLDDGEVGEHTLQYGGGGPDSNYSYTGWAYVYLYRLMSGRNELDRKLLRAMRWFSAYNTVSAFPVVTGASVRMRRANPDPQDILPGLERYSRQEPFFASLAEHILDKKERFLPRFRGHITSPLIWALWEMGVEAPRGQPPDWATSYTAVYDRAEVQYAVVGRAYQTGVVFRGRMADYYYSPLRGMQTFAFGGELPVLMHSDTANSSTQADGVDLARVNSDEVFLKEDGRLATITDRHKTVWTLYAYTPVSTVVVYGSARGPITSRWVMNRMFVSGPSLHAGERCVSFEGRQARLYYAAGEPRLDAAGGELEVVSNGPLSAFAFSNGSFRFDRYDALEVAFSDASGSYRLNLADVLDADRSINRGAPMRLVKR